jgi:hypothetical protein
MNIACFKYSCSSCGHNFYAPALSDFSYGEFLFSSRNGKYYAHLDAIGNPVVNEVEAFLKKNNPLASANDLVSRLWTCFPRACDLAPDGTQFEIGINKCPQCGGHNTLVLEISEKHGSAEVPALTHKGWSLLSEDQKRSKVLTV